jgi:cell wall-associated NlpC family hydrolase
MQGKSVANIGESKPGDLLLFQNQEGKINHTGIMIAPDKIIHASGKVRIDHINEEGILNLDTKIYTHRLSGIRRILSE